MRDTERVTLFLSPLLNLQPLSISPLRSLNLRVTDIPCSLNILSIPLSKCLTNCIVGA